MFSKESLDFLERLMMASGPSGFETETAAVFRSYIARFCEKTYTDVMGNTVGVLNGASKFKVMLAGHYDEIGFQVVHISDDGYLYFRNVGGIDKLTVPGTEVEILAEKGRVHGVIGKKPIHLAKDQDKALELKDMWIDIGVSKKKEAAKIIRIGDPVAVKSNYRRIGKSRIVSKGMDDKIGAFVVAETLKVLKSRDLKVAVYGVGTVQEELGLRGATTSAFGIAPDVGFAVDVGFATDVPDIEKKVLGELSLGKGPAISRTADNNPVLLERLVRTAKKKKIKYQEKAGFRASGGTDTATIQLSRSGVATALISIPNRYMHTPVEMCDLADAEGAVSLLAETICAFREGDSFIPGIDG